MLVRNEQVRNDRLVDFFHLTYASMKVHIHDLTSTPALYNSLMRLVSPWCLLLRRLYKTVFPRGLDDYATPATSKVSSPSPSILSASSSNNTAKAPRGLFGSISRFGGSLLTAEPVPNPVPTTPDGPIEELIMSGTAFGQSGYCRMLQLLLRFFKNHSRIRVILYHRAECISHYLNQNCMYRLFNLVFSLLPAGVR